MNALPEKVEFLPTRQSLIEALKNVDNEETWREFFNLYWKLIYGVALKCGLNHHQSEQVVQETIISVTRSINGFQCDPARAGFKSWLLTITYRRIADLKRREFSERNKALPSEGEPDDSFQRIWDEEWTEAVKNAALDALKTKVPPRHYQAFFLHVLKEVPALETAEMVGLNIGQLYLLKHRISRQYKNLLRIAEHRLATEEG